MDEFKEEPRKSPIDMNLVADRADVYRTATRLMQEQGASVDWDPPDVLILAGWLMGDEAFMPPDDVAGGRYIINDDSDDGDSD